MELKRKNVLVTGGAGFIGSHLADRLVTEGCRVRVLDNLSTGRRENINPDLVTFWEGDVRNEKDVEKALEGIEIVFHQAAQINPAKAVDDPMFDFEVNARGTLNLLAYSIKAGVKKFIMASTNVYGNAPLGVMPEELPTLFTTNSLLSPYAASKVCAEAYLKVANDELGLPTVRLRYFNVYGPRQLTKSESGVVAIFTLRALSGQPLRIFGDGTHTRDFVYVSDVVEANVLAARREEVDGGVFNIGTGIETSVRELAEMIREITGSRVPIEYGPPRAADFRRARADSRLAREKLGFKAKVKLAEGLKRYVNWCRGDN
jgi:UDP-glucose 4-epimerase